MFTRNPISLSVARSPRRTATAESPRETGPAAGLPHRAGRFLPRSEPQRLLLNGCVCAVFATTMTIVGGISLLVGQGPLFPVACLGLAASTIYRIAEISGELRTFEQRLAEGTMKVVAHVSTEAARLRIENMHLERRLQAAGSQEGIPAASGATVGDGGVVSPTVEAPNVIRPKSWRH